jgi:hypothetical protein
VRWVLRKIAELEIRPKLALANGRKSSGTNGNPIVATSYNHVHIIVISFSRVTTLAK